MTQLRVLVVDDDYRVAGIHAAYVERTDGFTVIGQAHTALQALDLATRLHPDLVLMDVYLPDGNGLDVVRSLLDKADPPAIIVISAARELAEVRTSMQLGVVHYLVKPFGYEVLATQLAAYQRLRLHLDNFQGTADQADVDKLFQLMRSTDPAPARPPKGHSAPTLDMVLAAVRLCPGDISAIEIAEQVGISRATAQRYLNYLQRQGVVTLQLRYGATGRPEHRYRTDTR